MNKIILLSATLCASLTLTSCASYRASALCIPSPDLLQNTAQTDKIKIVSKTFSKEDCYQFLDRNVLVKGYQPVQLYIQNNSGESYNFSLERISLPIASPDEVAEKVHTSTVGRAVGYGAGALILWPLAIPAIVDGVGSHNANEALDRDFTSKAARNMVLFPYSSLNMIVFVPIQGYQDSFSLTLVNQKTAKPKTFQIQSRR